MERVLTSSWVSSSASFRGRPTPCWETALGSLESRGSNPPRLSLSAFPAGTAPLSACAEFSQDPVWKQGSRSRMNPGSYEFLILGPCLESTGMLPLPTHPAPWEPEASSDHPECADLQSIWKQIVSPEIPRSLFFLQLYQNGSLNWTFLDGFLHT